MASKKQVTFAVLGPAGTFSDAALEKYASKQNAGGGFLAKKLFFKSLPEVFDAAESGVAQKAVAPVENALGGTIYTTLDRLYSSDLCAEAEVLVVVSYCVARLKGAKKPVEKIFGHPQAFEQCRNYLSERFPNAARISSLSNVQALKDLAASGDETAAALGPEKQAKALGLEIIARNAEDAAYNVTRFFIIGKNPQKPTGNDRTSLVVEPSANRRGILHEILGEFSSRGINLSKVESRPSRRKLGEYVFFIDFEGHQHDEGAKAALEAVSKVAKVKILGSYPREY